jgi:tRNA(Ile)-lysidine synthase TilS/MesJ
MYAFYKKLDYFSTECIYAPNAYRGFAREFLKDVEVGGVMCRRPSRKLSMAVHMVLSGDSSRGNPGRDILW